VKTFDLKYIFYVIATFALLIFQFVPPINYLVTILVSIFIVYAFHKRWASGIIPILALSFIHGEGSVSIYTLKLAGVSLFYVLLIVLFLMKVISRMKISKQEIFIFLYFLSYMILSIVLGNFYEMKYFVNDAVFLLIGIIFLYVIYDNKKIPFDKILLSLSMGYFLAKIVVFHTGIGLQVIPYSYNVDQYNAIFDPVENFLLIYNLQVFIFPNFNSQRILAFLNLMLFMFASYLLGYVHGATLMLIFFVLFYNIIRNIKVFMYFSLVIVTTFIIVLNIDFPVVSGGESVFLYKLEKVFGLIQFFYDSNISIYDLPRSTQVRLIETANLLHQNFLLFFLGNGFGGYITETAYFYGSYLNQDDYSIDQIITGKFQILHAYNQIVLKHGVLSLLIAFVSFYFLRNRHYRNFRDTALIFVVFSYSFTIKPYLILALLVFVIMNQKGNEIEKC
jgi:hypothetical protein